MTANWEGIEMTLEAAIAWERMMLLNLLARFPSNGLEDICRGALATLREVEVSVLDNDNVGQEQLESGKVLLQGVVNSRKTVEFAVNGTVVEPADDVSKELEKPACLR